MPASSAYVRVSSRTQDHATQRAAIERAAAARGDTITVWYAEKRSAKTLDRAELQRLRADARMGTISTLYIFKVDRLCRSGVADTFQVIDELRRQGVTIVAVADNMTVVPNKEDVTSEVLVFALGLAAKLERSAINDRISASRERIEAEGGRWGRPSRVDQETRDRAAALKAEGKTVREIARTLKVPRSTIGRSLSRKGASKTGVDSSIDPVGQ
jgi:DNA invertase Pin-like site-specific DNA recombinase